MNIGIYICDHAEVLDFSRPFEISSLVQSFTLVTLINTP